MSSPTRAPESCDFRKIRVCRAFLRYARFVTDGKTRPKKERQKPKPAINPGREGARTAQPEPGHRSRTPRPLPAPRMPWRSPSPRGRARGGDWALSSQCLFFETPTPLGRPNRNGGMSRERPRAEAGIGARSDVLLEIKAARGDLRDARRMLHARADECYTPERMYTPPRACRAAASGKLSAGVPFG
jgi:hypothetical protein